MVYEILTFESRKMPSIKVVLALLYSQVNDCRISRGADYMSSPWPVYLAYRRQLAALPTQVLLASSMINFL